MSRILYVIVTADGVEHRGEYVGAADGFMYLSDGDEVIRVEQDKVRIIATKQVPGE